MSVGGDRHFAACDFGDEPSLKDEQALLDEVVATIINAIRTRTNGVCKTMMHFSKELCDTNYSRLETYMREKDYSDTAASNIHLVFVISQSEEARDSREVLLGRELPIVESFHDLYASIELLKLGFYKQAVASLRMALDTGLLSAHWNAVGYDTPEFKRWISSKAHTPRKDSSFWRPIRQLPGVEEFYNCFSFESSINEISHQLNDHIHTKGFWYSTTAEFQRKMRTQHENVDCDRWYEMFVAATRIIVTLQLLVKPKLAVVVPDEYLLRKFGSHEQMPFCGVLFGDFSDRLELCVGEAEYNAISAIAETRPEVNKVRKYLEGCPDLKDDEIREINRKFWKSTGQDVETVEIYVNETLRSIHEFEGPSLKDSVRSDGH
ncbi:MAG: hypothetical protein OXC31_04150 [Spirochaetaceae bacterium]|nr:hypothetical protein [Spirochaetaceae bacterium]